MCSSRKAYLNYRASSAASSGNILKSIGISNSMKTRLSKVMLKCIDKKRTYACIRQGYLIKKRESYINKALHLPSWNSWNLLRKKRKKFYCTFFLIFLKNLQNSIIIFILLLMKNLILHIVDYIISSIFLYVSTIC